jgi:SAM-dependent methyltransferase
MSSDANLDDSADAPSAQLAEAEPAAPVDAAADASGHESLFPERFVPGEMRGMIEAEHLARYIWSSSHAAGRSVLDAGCGVGYGLQILIEAGATSAAGVDIAIEAVEATRRRVGSNANIVQGDVAALPFPDASFGLVVCFETIEHLDDQERALDELRRVLEDDGLLVLSSPNRDVYQQGNPHHTHEFTPAELEEALASRFENVRLVRQQGWLASMIVDDELLRAANGELKLDALRKIAGVEPGRETFTLALASDGPLPSDRSLAVITDLGEFDAWQARARSAESHLERATRHGEEAQEAYEAAVEERKAAEAETREIHSDVDRLELRIERVNNLLAERNAALRVVAEELDELRAEATQVRHELAAWRGIAEEMQHSPSWRITAPLRALARIARRT